MTRRKNGGDLARRPVNRGKLIKTMKDKHGGKIDRRPPEEQQALIHDPWELHAMQDYMNGVQSHTPYGLFALKQMATQPWISAIIATRQNQVAEFAVPRRDEYGLGFRIALRDSEKAPNSSESKEARRIESLMETCGTHPDRSAAFTADYFETFLRKLVSDSLTYETGAFEIIPDNRGLPLFWQAVDGSTIYKVAPNTPYGGYSDDQAAFVQVMNGQKVAWFGADELCFGIRRPKTDVKLNGYGTPELGELVSVLTAILYGWGYNYNFFKNGGPKGVLAVMGDMTKESFRVFQRQLTYQAIGSKNAYRMLTVNPAGNGADLKWVPFTGLTPKDMEFSEWVNSNFRLACSLYQIDPAEVGFYYQAEGTSKSMYESSPEAKLKSGKDKGLRPLLRAISSWLNRYIIWRLNPDFEIRFLGLDAMSEMERMDLDKARIETYMTVNELRAERDLEPLKEENTQGEGDIIMNPTYVQWKQVVMANAAEEEDGGEEGEPPEDGGDEQASDAPQDGEGGDDGDDAGDEEFDYSDLFDDSKGEDAEASKSLQRWEFDL